MPVPKNLVWEQSSSTGTGNKTLVRYGGFARVSEAFGTGDAGSANPVLFFANKDATSAEWEVVQGYMSDANTFVPVTVLDSSNSGSAVTFTTGLKHVTNDIHAAYQIYNPNSTVTDGHAVVFDGTTGRQIKSAGVYPYNPNVLINPDGFINQRVAGSGIADDTYHVDRWYALTQTAALDVSQLSNVADGVPSMIRLTQPNATAQRIGSAQIVESITSRKMRGSDVCLSGKVRMSAAATVAYAILAWTGTADSVTSDVVNSWTNATLTTGNFFNSSNLSVVATGTLALAANTVTDFSVTGSVPSGCNNLIVMIWSSATMAQTDTLDFLAKLEKGSVATAFVTPNPDAELNRCLWFYQAIKPSGNSGAIIGYRLSTQYINGAGSLLARTMRITPTASHSSPSWVTAAPSANNEVCFRVPSGSYTTISGALTITLFPASGLLDRWFTIQAGTSFSGSAGDIGSIQFGAGVRFYFDAEL